MLRRYQPISRAAQWSETVRWIDQRTRKPQSLADATLTMALYQSDGSCRRDYGRILPGYGNPVLSAATQDDGGGPFFILPDGMSAQFTIPAASLTNLWPGDALLVIWAMVGGQTDEIQRDTIRVLDGPRAMPLPIGGSAGPTPSGRVAVVDQDYTANPRNAYIAFTALTAPRTVTLPAASAYPQGVPLFIADESGNCSPTLMITIAAKGQDGIGGPSGAQPSVTIGSPFQKLAFNSNGSNLWTVS